MLKRRGAKTDPCATPFLRRRKLLRLFLPVVKSEAPITNHFNDHAEHVPDR